MDHGLRSAVAVPMAVAALLVGCSGVDQTGPDTGELRGPTASRTSRAETSSPPSRTSSSVSTPTEAAATDPMAEAAPSDSTAESQRADTARQHSEGRPRRAVLSIPSLGLRDLPVVPYRGWTDDAPGTAIQNRGRAASPYGPHGGVGPGGIGNYQVTAHRTSSTRAFEFLPDLRQGDRVIVETRKVRHVYSIERTRETSFRSARSLAEQRAAVPGRPGAVPTRAFITLSTCATPEDHAAGNYWADEFDNPEHRIDKIGVLVRSVGLSR